MLFEDEYNDPTEAWWYERELLLPMKKKWYDLILSGEKKEEYRLATPYWKTRVDNIVKREEDENLSVHQTEDAGNEIKWNFNKPKALVLMFKNGYQKVAPWFTAAVDWYLVRKNAQHPEWGEGEYDGKEHFVFHIGQILEIKE